MVRVSVVLPTYNRANWLPGAIETALDQTYESLRVLVIDDGSTDETPEVLSEYSDHPKVRTFRNDRNRGIAYTRNRGTELADGEYICVLDDDDRWNPGKVERQVKLMDRRSDEYCGVFTDGRRIHDGDVVYRVETGARGDVYPEILVRNFVLPHASLLLRRDALISVGGYDTEFDRAVDWDLMIRLAKSYQFEHIEEPLVDRILHDENITADPKYDVDVRSQIYEKYESDIEDDPAIRDKFMGLWERERGLLAVSRGERTKSVTHFITASRLDPCITNIALVVFGILGKRALSIARSVT